MKYEVRLFESKGKSDSLKGVFTINAPSKRCAEGIVERIMEVIRNGEVTPELLKVK